MGRRPSRLSETMNEPRVVAVEIRCDDLRHGLGILRWAVVTGPDEYADIVAVCHTFIEADTIVSALRPD